MQAFPTLRSWSMLCVPVVLVSALTGCGDDESEDKKGTAMPTATAELASFMAGTVTGKASFAQNGSDVYVEITLNNCVDKLAYPVHIHAGTACDDATTQGDHWGPARGEGIPNIPCTGTRGRVNHARPAAAADTTWTVGGDPTTNVVGHVIVVHEAPPPPDSGLTPTDPPPRIACGVIVGR
jgi:Cu/Zn superoxide dismutase